MTESPIPRDCLHCGQPMARRRSEAPAQYADRKYCSHHCRALAVQERMREGKFVRTGRGPSGLQVGRGELAWMRQAACAGMDLRLFFLDPGMSSAPARAACAGCPVRVQCQSWGLAHESYGIWGGLTEEDRRRVRAGVGT